MGEQSAADANLPTMRRSAMLNPMAPPGTANSKQAEAAAARLHQFLDFEKGKTPADVKSRPAGEPSDYPNKRPRLGASSRTAARDVTNDIGGFLLDEIDRVQQKQAVEHGGQGQAKAKGGMDAEGQQMDVISTELDEVLFPRRPTSLNSLNNQGSETDKHPSEPKRPSISLKPYRLRAPKTTPRYKTGKFADFFPWIGKHREDILNETTATSGHYDKGQVSQNEMGSARSLIVPLLKDADAAGGERGLDILSFTLCSTLKARQLSK
jgi:hypothetical protein